MPHDETAPHYSTPVTAAQVQRDAHAVASWLDYWRWFADLAGDCPITPGEVWQFYALVVRQGRYPAEVAEELGLPVHPDW